MRNKNTGREYAEFSEFEDLEDFFKADPPQIFEGWILDDAARVIAIVSGANIWGNPEYRYKTDSFEEKFEEELTEG